MGRQIRQQLPALGRLLAFDAHSPTGCWHRDCLGLPEPVRASPAAPALTGMLKRSVNQRPAPRSYHRFETQPAMIEPRLQLSGISKRYPGVVANDAVSLTGCQADGTQTASAQTLWQRHQDWRDFQPG